MKRTCIRLLFLLPVFLCSLAASHAQSLKKYPVSNSGCSLYSYCDAMYVMAFSEDSSRVYTGECSKDEVTYGIICVALLEPVADPEQSENLLVAYLDHLQSSLDITKSAGYGMGHRLNNDENTRGILDYWEDKEGNSWKVKAWTNGSFIGVLYAYSKQELPESKVNVFLESFRMPG